MKEISSIIGVGYSHINRVINNKKAKDKFPELRKIITQMK